jgi:hypothetical protein
MKIYKTILLFYRRKGAKGTPANYFKKTFVSSSNSC